MNAYEAALTEGFSRLDLPQAASEWLVDLWRTIQLFDDIADGDYDDRKQLDAAVWASLVKMPSNPFYQAHQTWLIPACATAILKWLASDKAEVEGNADERSFVWRAGYYDVVCLCAALVHGPSSDKSQLALGLYGETFKEYMSEFENA